MHQCVYPEETIIGLVARNDEGRKVHSNFNVALNQGRVCSILIIQVQTKQLSTKYILLNYYVQSFTIETNN